MSRQHKEKSKNRKKCKKRILVSWKRLLSLDYRLTINQFYKLGFIFFKNQYKQ